MGIFEARGFKVTLDSDDPKGEIAVVNTCGFIADAKEESINTILELAAAKTAGRLQHLYVMGCLSERYLADLEREIPEVDGWYGKFNFRQLADDIATLPGEGRRHLTTPRHYAYLKISEGCDRTCAYCAIPLMTGHHKSRSLDDILDEVRWLVSQGVKELQVMAQELTYYGQDIYGKQCLPELVEQMAAVPGVEWIRLHYGYPQHFPWELTRVMREHDNVCNYLDIALQHVSDSVLNRMRRNITREETIEFISRLRREVPGIHLRTTLMVGFPGETEEDFGELLDFVRLQRFERMGAFAYSEEEGTFAANHYVDDVPQEVKQRRLSKLMRLQQDISAEIEAEKIGQTLRVIIDRREGNYYVGRSEYCSPEVDPEVLIAVKHGRKVCIGQFYNVKITGAEEFDLYGEIEE